VRGATPPFLLFAFMVCTGTILPVIFQIKKKPIEILLSKATAASTYCIKKYDQRGSNCLGVPYRSWKDYVNLILTHVGRVAQSV
jgi:hypothetical protein